MADPRAQFIISARDDATRQIDKIKSSMSSLGALSKSVSGLLLRFGGPVAIGVAAARSLQTMVTSADAAQQQLRRLDALLASTGNSARLSRDEIEDFSRALAKDTLASVQGVRDAASALLTFRSISGDTFKQTLELSQDLAATMGTNLRSAAVQLAKALEDPAAGLSALRDSGVSFTKAEQDKIKSLQASGRQLEAQNVILDKVRQQVGGAGAAQGQSLTGAVQRLTENWAEMLERVGNSGPIQAVTGLFDKLAGAIDKVNARLAGADQDRFYQLADRRIELLDRLEKAQGRTGQARRQTSDIRRELAEIETEMRALQDRNIERMRRQMTAQTAEPVRIAVTGGTVGPDDNELKRLASLAATLQQPYDKLYSSLVDLDTLLSRGMITWDEYAEATFDALEGVGNRMDPVREQFEGLDKVIEGWGRNFADTLLDAGGSMSDFADTVLRQLARIALAKTFDPFFSLFGDWVSNSAGSLFGGFRASGGPVSGNKTYLVGEQGPELFTPNAAGSIIPNDALGGSGVVVNVHNHATGTQATTREREENGVTIIDVMIEQVKGAIAADISRGAGAVPNALQGVYGLNRVAGVY